MKLVVFGANGGVGREIVSQAAEAGHQVVAVVRNDVAEAKHNMQYVQGDITDADSVARLTQDCDVVIVAIGAANKQPVTLYSRAAIALTEGMGRSGADRLIILSAGGATVESNDPVIFKVLIKPILQKVFKYLYQDMLRMERLLEASDLQWTIIRLSYLVDKPLTGRYRVAREQAIRYGRSINRADVAHYIVHNLENPEDYRHHICIAN